MVTIAITCYNYGEYIAKSIESALSQTYDNIELIVIDDGSTDDSLEVINRYKSKLKIIARENKGIVYTRNEALDIARGDFLFFLDADDYFDDDYIESMVAVAEKYEADVVYPSWRLFGDVERERTFPEFELQKLVTQEVHCTAESLIRLSAVNDSRFESETVAEDWDFFLGLALGGATFKYASGCFINYRIKQGGRGKSRPYWEDMYHFTAILQKWRERYPDKINPVDLPIRAIRTILDRNRLLDEKNLLIQQKVYAQEAEISKISDEIAEIKESISYRLGNKLALPVRFSKRFFKKINSYNRQSEGLLATYYQKVPKKGIKITLVLKDAHSPNSSSFIRLISPLIHAKKYDIQIVDGGKWSDIRPDTEVCIVQRVALADEHEAEKLISFLKKNDILLMTDNDDAFCDVGVDHAHYSQIHPRSSGLTLLMKHAAANFYSTEKLRDRYGELTSRTDGIVVRNMLDKELWPRWQRNDIGSPDMHEPLRVVYMGTKTHGADFLMIKNALQRVYEDMPGSFELTVIGVASEIENEEWITTITPENSVYPGFTRWFSEQGPFDIGLSPLEDTEFNSAKSDIKCLDYIALGARPLVSDVLAYENSELNEYIARVKNTENDWYEAFKQCVLDREHVRQDRSWVTEGYDFLQKKRSVDVTSARMIKIIQKYMAR